MTTDKITKQETVAREQEKKQEGSSFSKHESGQKKRKVATGPSEAEKKQSSKRLTASSKEEAAATHSFSSKEDVVKRDKSPKKPLDHRSQKVGKKPTAVGRGDGQGAPRVRVRLKSYDHRLLEASVKSIVEAVRRTGAEEWMAIPLPTASQIFTTLISPHTDKDARDQYIVSVHKRLIDIISPTDKTMDALMKLYLPAGVDVAIS